MDIHEIPFEDNQFDIIFCNHVLEHVRDDKLAMSEMLRVLKPGGWAILQIPIFHPLKEKTIEDPSITDPKERETLFGQDDHVRMYGLDYADRIREAGFRVVEEKYAMELESELVAKYALPKDEIIHRAEKIHIRQ
jgi:SAM-dependent methyltransferase